MPHSTPITDRDALDALDPDGLDLDELHRRHSYKWNRHDPDVVPAWVAEMDYPLAGPVLDAVRAAVGRHDLGYVHPSYRPLGEAFAGWVATEYGWSVDPGDVFTLADVMRGVELALESFTEPGDPVVVDTPIYPPFMQAITARGRVVAGNPLAPGNRPDLDGLAARFAGGARAYLLCNPHNPTGHVFTAGELARVLELAAEHDVLVVSDEIHAPLTHPGARHLPAATLAAAAGVRMVTVTSHSKAWNVPGLKCAVATAAHPRVLQVLRALPERIGLGAGILGVDTAVAAYTHGGPWLARVRAHLDRNRMLLADLLAERLPAVSYTPPQATYLAWIDCRALGFPDPAGVFLDRGRVALADGAAFGPPGEGFVRLSFATARGVLEQIVDRMAAAL